jgi:hypothetical protein
MALIINKLKKDIKILFKVAEHEILTLSRGRSLNRSSVGRVRIVISLKFFGRKKNRIDENVLGGRFAW